MLQLTQAEVLENWLAELANEDYPSFWSTIKEIAGLGPDAVPRLLEVLEDAQKSERTRACIADALGNIGDARAIQPLFALQCEKDTDLSVSVVIALERLGGPEPSQLLAALQDKNPLLRARAADLLGRFKVRDAMEPLQAMIADPDIEARYWAIVGLGRIGDRRALPSVLTAATDPSPLVQYGVRQALKQFGGPEVVPAMLSLLKSEHNSVRQSACYALRDMGDRAAQDALIAATQDADKVVREAAVGALERVGDVKAVPALLRLLDDEYPVQILAILALGELSGPDVIPSLLRVRPALDAVHMGLRVDNAIARIQERHGLA